MPSLADNLQRRLIDAQTALDVLDRHYAEDRAVLIKRINELQKAGSLITKEIQAAVDALGLEFKP